MDIVVSQLQVSYFSGSSYDLLFDSIIVGLYYNVPWQSIFVGCRQGPMGSVQFQPVRKFIWDEVRDKFLDYSFRICEGFGDVTNPEIVLAGLIFQVINLV